MSGNSESRLTDKVVIVTGAARGIGRETALLAAREEAQVLAVDVNTPQEPFPDAVEFVLLDVTDEEQWRVLVRRALHDHGRIDGLANIAGGGAGPDSGVNIVDLEVALWRRVLDLNMTSVFLAMKAVIPAMRRGGGGSIVNVSSIFGLVGVPRMPAYSTAKAGVAMLTQNTAVTYASSNIRVNTVAPGLIATPGTRSTDPELKAQTISATPLRRQGEPIDVARSCVFLLSDDACFVTGVTLPVDGGYLALGEVSSLVPAAQGEWPTPRRGGGA